MRDDKRLGKVPVDCPKCGERYAKWAGPTYRASSIRYRARFCGLEPVYVPDYLQYTCPICGYAPHIKPADEA